MNELIKLDCTVKDLDIFNCTKESNESDTGLPDLVGGFGLFGDTFIIVEQNVCLLARDIVLLKFKTGALMFYDKLLKRHFVVSKKENYIECFNTKNDFDQNDAEYHDLKNAIACFNLL